MFTLPPHLFTHKVERSLLPIAQGDYEQWLRLSRRSEKDDLHLRRLLNPIQAWAETLGAALGQIEFAPNTLRRQKADTKVDLDDEGAPFTEAILSAMESQKVIVTADEFAWYTKLNVRDELHTLFVIVLIRSVV